MNSAGPACGLILLAMFLALGSCGSNYTLEGSPSNDTIAVPEFRPGTQWVSEKGQGKSKSQTPNESNYVRIARVLKDTMYEDQACYKVELFDSISGIRTTRDFYLVARSDLSLLATTAFFPEQGEYRPLGFRPLLFPLYVGKEWHWKDQEKNKYFIFKVASRSHYDFVKGRELEAENHSFLIEVIDEKSLKVTSRFHYVPPDASQKFPGSFTPYLLTDIEIGEAQEILIGPAGDPATEKKSYLPPTMTIRDYKWNQR